MVTWKLKSYCNRAHLCVEEFVCFYHSKVVNDGRVMDSYVRNSLIVIVLSEPSWYPFSFFVTHKLSHLASENYFQKLLLKILRISSKEEVIKVFSVNVNHQKISSSWRFLLLLFLIKFRLLNDNVKKLLHSTELQLDFSKKQANATISRFAVIFIILSLRKYLLVSFLPIVWSQHLNSDTTLLCENH